MSQFDGVLRAQYEVHCFKCERPVLGLGSDRHRAARELVKSYGWSCIARRWHCPECSAALSAKAPQ